MIRRWLFLLILAHLLIVYILGYVALGHREQGRARGAGEYFHYRDFDSAWEVYVFAPAAYAEAQLIQIFPKAFLTNASWAETPQRLVIRVPDNSTRFWFPPLEKAGRTE